jgi:polyhydroxyalkanoate synthesis repressor PhaR
MRGVASLKQAPKGPRSVGTMGIGHYIVQRPRTWRKGARAESPKSSPPHVATHHHLVLTPGLVRNGVVAMKPGCAGAEIIMAKSKGTADDDVVTIKKYANRRLYDTERSCYITLDDLGAMVRDGREFRVVDAKSGEDITHNVLTQIIMDTETRGETLLPVSFLRQLIGMYGDKMQAMVPQYLEASMAAFRKNQQDVRAAFEGALGANPLAELTRRNMEMFQQAAGAFIPGASKAKDAEIAALKAEIAELKAELAGKK